jgi:integrase
MAGLQGIRGLYEKRGWFYYQPPTGVDGVRPKAVALKTRDLTDAIRQVDEMREEGALVAAVTAGTLAEVLPQYYAAKREDTVGTRRSRKMILEQFRAYAGNVRVSEISSVMVERWRMSLHERQNAKGRKLSGTTLKSYTITLRAFVNWLRAERMLRHDPMARLVRQTRVSRTRRQEFLTEEERERLLADEKMDDNVRMILHLGFFAGLRDTEMLALTPKWIWLAEDGSRGTLTVEETPIEFAGGGHGMWRPKTREMRTMPLHPRLLALLRDVDRAVPFVVAPKNALWPPETKNSKRYDAKKALAGVAKRTGVAKLTPHMMRRSFATHLAMKGVPLAEIAGLLGDSLKVTEDHYAGFCPNKVSPLDLL